MDGFGSPPPCSGALPSITLRLVSSPSVAGGPDPDRSVPLRIALLAEYYRPRLGGVEVFLSDLARQLSDRGNDVHVLTTTPASAVEQGERVPTVDEEAPGGESVTRVPSWRLPAVGVPFSPYLPGRFGRALASIAPDVVHVHASIGSAGALSGGWAAHRLGLPVVVTIHSRLGAHAWVHRLAHGLTGWAKWPHVLAGPSNYVAGDVARTVGRPVSVLPNGVDVSWWRDGPPCLEVGESPPDTLRLVAVQRLKGRKRGAALLSVVRAVQDRLPPGRRVALTMVGDGPRRRALEKRARELDIDVTFAGAVSRAGVRATLAAAHVFVLPCREEAFGIAAAEARAVGLPVVAYRTGALFDLVPDGRAGILVRGDGEMGTALIRMATERGLLQRLSRESRGLAPPFDWPDVAACHEDAYRRAISLAGSG